MKLFLLLLALIVQNGTCKWAYAQGGPPNDSGGGLQIRDEGSFQGRAKILDFVGAGVSAACPGGGVLCAITVTGGGVGGGTNYQTVQEENSNLTQQPILNFLGAAITAANDGPNTRTNVTLSQSPLASTSVVGTGRQILTTANLTGGGDLTADRTLDLANAGPGATGPIGDATHTPTITIDAKGRTTALTSTLITGVAPGGAAGGDLTGTYPNPTLAAIIGAGGPTGSATTVPVITWDAKGRLTVVSSAAIVGPFPPNGAAGGDLTGTYPNPTLAAIISAGGPTGNATTVPVITWDAKGRLTVVSTAAITGPFPPNGAASGDLSGTYPSPTVSKINGVAFNADPLAQYLLLAGRTSPNNNAIIAKGAGSGQLAGSDTTAQSLTLLANTADFTGTITLDAATRIFPDLSSTTGTVDLLSIAPATTVTTAPIITDLHDASFLTFTNVGGFQHSGIIYEPTITSNQGVGIVASMLMRPGITSNAAGKAPATYQGVQSSGIIVYNTPTTAATSAGYQSFVAGGTVNKFSTSTAPFTVTRMVAFDSGIILKSNTGSGAMTATSFLGFADAPVLQAIAGTTSAPELTTVDSKATFLASPAAVVSVAARRGLHMQEVTETGAGTYTFPLQVAVDVDNLTLATQNLALRSSGAAVASLHSGPFRIGDQTTPTEKLEVAGNILATGQLRSSVVTGTAPLQVASTTVVPNLNINMGGDVTGTSAASTVAKINGVAYNADPLIQYTLLAGRVGSTNDTTLSTSTDGTLLGSSASGKSLILKGGALAGGTPGVRVIPSITVFGSNNMIPFESTRDVTFDNAGSLLNAVDVSEHGTYLVTADLAGTGIFPIRAYVFAPTITNNALRTSLGGFAGYELVPQYTSQGFDATIADSAGIWFGPAFGGSLVANTNVLLAAATYAVYDAPSINPGSGSATLTNRYGHYLKNRAGTGTQTNVAGFYSEDQTATTFAAALESQIALGSGAAGSPVWSTTRTGKWGVYAPGTAPHLLGGPVYGSETASGNLVLRSTIHATKGTVDLDDIARFWPSLATFTGVGGFSPGFNVATFANTIAASGSGIARVLQINPAITVNSGSTTYIAVSGAHTITDKSGLNSIALFQNTGTVQSDTTGTTRLSGGGTFIDQGVLQYVSTGNAVNPTDKFASFQTAGAKKLTTTGTWTLTDDLGLDLKDTVGPTGAATQTVTRSTGVLDERTFSATGGASSVLTLPTLSSFDSFPTLTATASSSVGITDYRGLRVRAPTIAGAGTKTVTNMYGVDVGALATGGTLNVGFQTAVAPNASAPANYSFRDTGGAQWSAVGKFTTYNNIATKQSGLVPIYGEDNKPTQSANIGATTIYAVPASGAGAYRCSAYIVVTTAATTSSVMPNVVLAWTDQDNATAQSQTITSTAGTVLQNQPVVTGNSLTTYSYGTTVVNAKASTSITYTTANYASVGGTAMVYAVRTRCEAI